MVAIKYELGKLQQKQIEKLLITYSRYFEFVLTTHKQSTHILKNS